MRPTYLADCSSDTDVGSVARIQKLPSSSLGMNSRPIAEVSAKMTTTGTAAISTASRFLLMAKANSGT